MQVNTKRILQAFDQKLVESEEDLEDPEEFLAMLEEKRRSVRGRMQSRKSVRTCPWMAS